MDYIKQIHKQMITDTVFCLIDWDNYNTSRES